MSWTVGSGRDIFSESNLFEEFTLFKISNEPNEEPFHSQFGALSQNVNILDDRSDHQEKLTYSPYNQLAGSILQPEVGSPLVGSDQIDPQFYLRSSSHCCYPNFSLSSDVLGSVQSEYFFTEHQGFEDKQSSQKSRCHSDPEEQESNEDEMVEEGSVSSSSHNFEGSTNEEELKECTKNSYGEHIDVKIQKNQTKAGCGNTQQKVHGISQESKKVERRYQRISKNRQLSASMGRQIQLMNGFELITKDLRGDGIMKSIFRKMKKIFSQLFKQCCYPDKNALSSGVQPSFQVSLKEKALKLFSQQEIHDWQQKLATNTSLYSQEMFTVESITFALGAIICPSRLKQESSAAMHGQIEEIANYFLKFSAKKLESMRNFPSILFLLRHFIENYSHRLLQKNKTFRKHNVDFSEGFKFLSVNYCL